MFKFERLARVLIDCFNTSSNSKENISIHAMLIAKTFNQEENMQK